MADSRERRAVGHFMSLVCNLEKKQKKEILDDDHIQVIDRYFKTHRNSVRNRCIFHLLLYYGVERKNLAALKWSDFDLRELMQENEKEGFLQEYLFYGYNAQGAERLKDSSINEIFRKIADDSCADREAKQYSPQYIRKGLVRYLLEDKGCSLEEIMFWLDIDVENLKSYISNEELRQIVKNRNSRHPLE